MKVERFCAPQTIDEAVALLAAAVLVLFEMVLQIRERAASVTEHGTSQA